VSHIEAFQTALPIVLELNGMFVVTSLRMPLKIKAKDWPFASLVFAAIVFNLIFLFPEVSIPVPNLNDNVLHYTLVERASDALNSRDNILDPWVSYWDMGFPVFQYYQHLPHLFVAMLNWVTGGRLDLFTLFNWVKYLILAFFPLSIYISSRKLELPKAAAAFSALCASLLSTDGLFGTDFSSFVWRGSGLYPQIWGIVLFPLCLGQIYSTIKYNKGYFRSILVFTVLLLSHVIYAYMAVLSLLVFLFLRIDKVRFKQKVARLAVVFAFSGIVSSYFLIPFMLNGDYLNRSVWEIQEKYDSYGHKVVLEKLFNGDLLDYGRLPILTLLMFLGLARAITKRDESQRLTLALFFLWLLLYFGRPTWGVLLNILPMSSDLHLHRFIGGLHVASIFLIGIGLNALWDFVTGEAKRIANRVTTTRTSAGNGAERPRSRSRFVHVAVGCVLLAAILTPVWKERIRYLNENKVMMEATNEAVKHESGNIRELVDYLRGLQKEAPGRVFAGLATTWGKQFSIGDVRMYALLSVEKIDALSYLYHAMSLNADIQVHFDETQPAHYNLFNVGYVVAPRERTFPSFVSPIRTIGNWTVYKVDTSGYFDLVQSDIALYGTKDNWYRANFRWFNSDLMKRKEHPSIFFQRDPDDGSYRQWLNMSENLALPAAANSAPEDNGDIVSSRVENQAYSASVLVRKPCYLLFKMTYHPYWRVLVDNTAQETVMLSPSFIGVHLEPGEHQVKFQYQSPRYKALLLLLGFLTLIALVLFEKKLVGGLAPILEDRPAKRIRRSRP
jgi:hypothetical protein